MAGGKAKGGAAPAAGGAKGGTANKTWRFTITHWNFPDNSKESYWDAALAELGKIGPDAVKRFRDAAPQGVTGQLKAKMTYRRTGAKAGGTGKGRAIEIVMPWYGRVTIQGHVGTIYPTASKALRLRLSGGAIAFAKHVEGARPNPWHLKALADVRHDMQGAAARAARAMFLLLKRRAD